MSSWADVDNPARQHNLDGLVAMCQNVSRVVMRRVKPEWPIGRRQRCNHGPGGCPN